MRLMYCIYSTVLSSSQALIARGWTNPHSNSQWDSQNPKDELEWGMQVKTNTIVPQCVAIGLKIGLIPMKSNTADQNFLRFVICM